MKRPAFQFYPADWRKDTALQGCSLLARGLWHEMLCLMHECEPYGHLSVNGKPMKPAQVARLVGISEKEYQRVLAELIDAGVPSIADDGSVYSRRMVRDEQIREARAAGGKAGSEHGIKGAEHGKKGGRPKKDKGGLETPLPVSENPPPSSSSSSSTTKNLSVPDGTDADASLVTADGIDAKDALWQIAVPWMIERQVPDKSARSLLGAAVKVLREEGAWLLCQRMMQERPMEPAAWLAAALNAQTKISAVASKGTGLNRQEALEQRNRQIAAQLSEEFHKGVPQ
ncbi:hypothetical protein [Cupriavidus sp. D384]|uniref:hypothetical protein n=1 Tax=Cupriavidus sp. D384 TaxID=1538095 RepID=UPI00082BB632|nr:hypothetical protein [Cupriavidus sp. D384]